MTDTITRCPKCSTSFRITEAHLKSAKGAVRCGSCLNIFNARDHLVQPTLQMAAVETAATAPPPPKTAKKSSPKPKPKSSPAPAKKAPPPKQPTEDDDDILISDDMPLDDVDATPANKDFDADFNDNILYSKSLGSQDTNLFERDPINGGDDDDDVNSDESWALDLIESSDDEDLPTFRKDTGAYEAIDEPEDPTEPELDEYHVYDTSFTESVISDADVSSPRDFSEQEPGPGDYNEDDNNEGDYSENHSGKKRHQPVFTAIEPSITELESIAEDSYPEPPGQQHYIHAIEPEPVEFAYKRNYSFLESRLLWVPLITIMGLALATQIAWLQFDKLNRVEPYRSYYGAICNITGCELAPLLNRTEIRAVNLVVRSHPDQSGALVVDAVLQNSAPYPQSFPALDLVFTDMQDKPVTARRFNPDEYLGGELAGRRDMPSRQPIHITLEIVDPGPAAVGYRISIAN